MRKNKREILQWTATLLVILVLWLTGWHRPLVAGLQRAILLTGVMQPNTTGQAITQNNNLPNLSFIDEAGKKVTLADLPSQAMFINVWATWCPPCVAEMPNIQSLYEEMKTENVNFIMLATDRNFDTAKKHKVKHGYTFPIYHLHGSFPPSLQGATIPRTYVIDGNGNIRMRHEGMAKYNTKKFKLFLKSMNELEAHHN